MWTWVLMAVTAVGQVNLAGRRPAPVDETVSSQLLRLARSTDGLSFEDVGVVLARSASSPDLERLPNGDLLLLFDQTVESDRPTRSVMVASRSGDQGQNWSPLQALRVLGPNGRALEGHHPDLVRLGRRQYRLFFSCVDTDSGHVTVCSATTRNGLEYLADATLDQPQPSDHQVRPVVVSWRNAVHLYVSPTVELGKSDPDAPPSVTHFVSNDGREFRRAPARFTKNGTRFGKIIPTAQGLRLFAESEKGVISLVSKDGRRFEREPGTRLETGLSPAVVQLDDGSWLMAYCVRDSGPSRQRSEIEADPEILLEGIAPSDLGPPANASSEGLDWLVDEPLADSLDLPPRVDFDEPMVDYLEWYEQANQLDAPDNAFDAYAEFMPMPWDDPDCKADWPDLDNMFSDRSYNGPPQPWSPADHPDWEASHQQAQGLLDAFREAGRREQYWLPPIFGDERLVETPDGKPLLLEMQLPQLSPHRALAKATMADAWRMDQDGNISAGRMLDAFETTLRNAKHLANGTTLIENLVGAAEFKLIHRNALSALERGVFDQGELEEALDILMEYDRDDADPVRLLRGEHAMAMQVTQYLFHPDYSEQTRRHTAEVLSQSLSADDDLFQRIDEMTLDDAKEAVDAFDGYYLEMANDFRAGYPDVRAADMDAAAERYVHTNALTEALMPSLSRVHALRARAEASRRATQLAYATHLFKARNGRWPASLDELPEHYDPKMRTDPFTGRDLVYRVGEQGPTIYSASENGLDDGGIHSPRWDDEITNPVGSDDHVFWPPQD
ncbi:MAG: sialidase family protein [Phycisphaerae bacterium]